VQQGGTPPPRPPRHTLYAVWTAANLRNWNGWALRTRTCSTSYINSKLVPRQANNPHSRGGFSIHTITVAPPCFNCHFSLRYPNHFRSRSPIRLGGQAPHYVGQGTLRAGKTMESEPFSRYLSCIIESLRSCGGLRVAVHLFHTSNTYESTVRVVQVVA